MDVPVAGAICLRTPFIREVESLVLEWVIDLKDNPPDPAAYAERLINRPADDRQASPQENLDNLLLPLGAQPMPDDPARFP